MTIDIMAWAAANARGDDLERSRAIEGQQLLLMMVAGLRCL
ncbi:hypothetical protein [Sphingobium ummariense]